MERSVWLILMAAERRRRCGLLMYFIHSFFPIQPWDCFTIWFCSRTWSLHCGLLLGYKHYWKHSFMGSLSIDQRRYHCFLVDCDSTRTASQPSIPSLLSRTVMQAVSLHREQWFFYHWIIRIFSIEAIFSAIFPYVSFLLFWIFRVHLCYPLFDAILSICVFFCTAS